MNRPRPRAATQRSWSALRDAVTGAATVSAARWLFEPEFARAAARWGEASTTLIGGALALACVAIAAFLLQRRQRAGSERFVDDARALRRRRLAGLLGTLIATAVTKWAFDHIGFYALDHLEIWPAVAVLVGIPLAAFALVISLVTLPLRPIGTPRLRTR